MEVSLDRLVVMGLRGLLVVARYNGGKHHKILLKSTVSKKCQGNRWASSGNAVVVASRRARVLPDANAPCVLVTPDYYGDGVVNSLSNIVAMMLGFWIANRVPVWVSVGCVIAVESVLALVIRDNLTLNIVMLVHPVEVIK